MTSLLVFSFIGNIHSYLSILIVVSIRGHVFKMARDFTVDDFKDIVAGALTTILSRASETNRSNVDQRPRGSLQGQVDEEEVPPLPPPLQTEARRRYISYMIRYRCEYKLSYLHGLL